MQTSRRAVVPSKVSDGRGGGGLSFLRGAAGLVLVLAVMASVMTVPLKPLPEVVGGELTPPVPLDEVRTCVLCTGSWWIDVLCEMDRPSPDSHGRRVRCRISESIQLKSTTPQMSDYHLRTMPFPDLFHLFHTLEAPSETLEGEYLAEMLE